MTPQLKSVGLLTMMNRVKNCQPMRIYVGDAVSTNEELHDSTVEVCWLPDNDESR
jgi:hypothetical protein